MMQVDRYSFENLDFDRADQVLTDIRAQGGSAKGAGADA
jgi:hypothetical protein